MTTTDTTTTTTPGAGQGTATGTPGESTAPGTAAAGAPAADGTQTPAAGEQTQTPQTDLTKRTAKDDNGKEWTAEEAVAEMRRLRDADARKRVERKGLPDALRTLAEAAGLDLPDEAPTLESVQRDLQARQVDLQRSTERADKAEAELAIAQAAWKAGISPDRAGYLSFLMSSDTEVQAARGTDQFGATVSSKITSLAGSDPMLKGAAGSGGSASGPDSFGGANGTSAITAEQFQQMGYEDRLALFQKNPEEYRRLSAG